MKTADYIEAVLRQIKEGVDKANQAAIARRSISYPASISFELYVNRDMEVAFDGQYGVKISLDVKWMSIDP